MTAKDWIEKLELEPHPEGGWFKEVYRSEGEIAEAGLPEMYAGPRNFATHIYYLLEAGQKSTFHRLHSDELWHLYDGGPLEVHQLRTGVGHEVLRLAGGETVHGWIPGGVFFGAKLGEGAEFALAGCTVAPGFDFDDFEFSCFHDLLDAFPNEAAIIDELARRDG